MNINAAISALIDYAEQRGLIGNEDRAYSVNMIIDMLGVTEYEYDGNGNMIKETASDYVTEYTYDSVGNKISAKQTNSDDNVQTTVYTYSKPSPTRTLQCTLASLLKSINTRTNSTILF